MQSRCSYLFQTFDDTESSVLVHQFLGQTTSYKVYHIKVTKHNHLFVEILWTLLTCHGNMFWIMKDSHYTKLTLNQHGNIYGNACVTCETWWHLTTKTVWLPDRHTHIHRRPNAGQSDHYVLLGFGGETTYQVICTCVKVISHWNLTFLSLFDWSLPFFIN